MKILRILNRINTVMLFAYIPLLLFDADNYLYTKEGGENIFLFSLILFFTTFICGGAILVTAVKTNVENEFSIKEAISVFGVKKVILLTANFILCAIMMIVLINNANIFFYIACMLISTIFVIGEAVVIERIDTSYYYKITLPWYTFPVPFIYFISSNIWISYSIDENHTDAVIVFNFILTGIMLMYCAWHFSYIIDEKSKTIEKEYGVLSVFIPNKVIHFEKINYITKHGIYYTISDGERTFKIARYMSSTKKLEKVLKDNGIYIADSKLI